MKKTALFLLSIIVVIVSVYMVGCDKYEQIDYSIDMSPRLIALSGEVSLEEVVSAVKPAVVGISAKSSSGEAVGSGVAVSSGGYILTNQHVIDSAKSLTVYFANKQTSNAQVVWQDTALDLAIIKCQKSIPYLEMSSAANLKQGEDVLAIGTPLSLQFRHSVTKGIVSALNRTIEVSPLSGNSSYLQNLIQHDASINPGNSGGPLINRLGQVVGINTLKATDAEGIGFAIPIEVSFPIINKLSTGASLDIPYIGIYGFDATIASFYGRTFTDSGVFVLNVSEKSPADNAEIKIDDVITHVGETKVDTMLDLRVAIYSLSKGDETSFTLKRGDETLVVRITL